MELEDESRWNQPGRTANDAFRLSFATLFYFSTETFTSLGFGDMMPVGPIRMLAGIEALNGLLLIGWSASYLYIAMERYWGIEHKISKSKQ